MSVSATAKTVHMSIPGGKTLVVLIKVVSIIIHLATEVLSKLVYAVAKSGTVDGFRYWFRITIAFKMGSAICLMS